MKKYLLMVLAVFLLGCESTKPTKPADVVDKSDNATNTAQTNAAASSSGVKNPGVSGNTVAADPTKDANNVLSKRIIYFDYDKDLVRDEFANLIQAHAKYLNENKGRKIKLEGHADERGSREYNVTLGQRRADTVRKALSVLGVTADRVETISFGEDKPKSGGHDEAAWAQNRRVEIRYDGE